MKENHKDLIGKILNISNYTKYILSRYIFQDRLLGSELSSSLREVGFGEYEFYAKTSMFNLKYHYSRLQNNNLFYLFYD